MVQHLDIDDEPTPVSCLGCHGQGQVQTENQAKVLGVGSYRLATCPWCDGSGVMNGLKVRDYALRLRTKAIKKTWSERGLVKPKA